MGAKILVVDDEEVFVEIVRNWFEEDGYQTEGAGNGVEALERLSTFKADLVFSGIVMPHMDGLTLLRHCHENYPGLPVILTSGSRSFTEEELKKHGAVGFLPKPFSQDDLRKLLKGCHVMPLVQSLLENLDEILGDLTEDQLERYDYLQRELLRTDVTNDPRFQRTFNGFYRMGQKPHDWYLYFYGLLEARKRDAGIQFQEVLRTIHRDKGRVEPSFSSKLVATIRADSPVYDRYVRENLGLQIPPQWAPAQVRLNGLIQVYDQLSVRILELVNHPGFRTIKHRFDQRFPQYTHFTDVKKLDLVLWQHRIE